MNDRERSLRPVWHLLPSGFSVPFVVLGMAWLLMFGSCSGVLAVTDAASGTATASSLTGAGVVVGLVVLPVGALLFLVGAVLAGRWAARALLLGITGATLLLGLIAGLASIVYSGTTEIDPLFVAVGFVVALVVVLLLFVTSVALAVRQIRASLAQARRERTVELVAARGELDFESVARELRVSPHTVPAYLDALVGEGALRAVLDAEAAMVFSPERYAQKQRDVVSVAWGRGKASLAELAAELRVSPPRLHALLVTALEAGMFTGFLDARTGEVVSAASAALRDGRTCPSCGGQMDLAGRGVVVCPYCQAEVFLAA
jgi:DNA-binding Lrp family transcriptional regulator